MAAQSQALQDYHSLGRYKNDFKTAVQLTTGWSNGTFYNKLQRPHSLTEMESTALQKKIVQFKIKKMKADKILTQQ